MRKETQSPPEPNYLKLEATLLPQKNHDEGTAQLTSVCDRLMESHRQPCQAHTCIITVLSIRLALVRQNYPKVHIT